MLENYIPIFIFFVIGVMFGVIPLLAGMIIGPSNPSEEKNSPYECGFEPFGDSRSKFDVRFYLISILFIIFDLEIAFLFPWAVVLDVLNWDSFIAMGLFLLLLTVGFIYEWFKGALEWE